MLIWLALDRIKANHRFRILRPRTKIKSTISQHFNFYSYYREQIIKYLVCTSSPTKTAYSPIFIRWTTNKNGLNDLDCKFPIPTMNCL